MIGRAKPAEVEIVELWRGPGEPPQIVRANQVIVNGTPILCPVGEDAVRVHGFTVADHLTMDSEDETLVKVTITMFARRVVIDQRSPQ